VLGTDAVATRLFFGFFTGERCLRTRPSGGVLEIVVHASEWAVEGPKASEWDSWANEWARQKRARQKRGINFVSLLLGIDIDMFMFFAVNFSHVGRLLSVHRAVPVRMCTNKRGSGLLWLLQ